MFIIFQITVCYIMHIVARVTNVNNKVLPVRRKEKETIYVKIRLSVLPV